MWIKIKLVDLEDRSRRNNLRISGIPESVQSSQLPHFVCNLFAAVILSLSTADHTIDRVHRVPKLSFLPEEVPRDVILQVHFFQVKEQLLAAFYRPYQLPEQVVKLQLLPDLSQFALQQHKNLISITKAFKNHNILYKWKYMVKLKITHRCSTSYEVSLKNPCATKIGYHSRTTSILTCHLNQLAYSSPKTFHLILIGASTLHPLSI